MSGFTVLVSVLSFGGAVRLHRRDHRRADRSGAPDSGRGRGQGGLASRPPTSPSNGSGLTALNRKACDDGSPMSAGPSVATTNHTLEVVVNEHAATPQFGTPSIPSVRDARKATGYWWVLLTAGIAWVAVALVILQFDQASVTTVGILVGLMFLARRRELRARRSTCRRAGPGRCSAGCSRVGDRQLRQPGGHLRRPGRHPRLSVPDHRRLRG